MRPIHVGLLLLSATFASAARADGPAATSPAATQPADDPAYLKLVADLVAARDARSAAQAVVQQRLKALAADQSPAAAQERIVLLRRRRELDLKLRGLTREFQAVWFGRQLAPAVRPAYAELTLEERLELLDGRSAEQRLAVPLPAMAFERAKLADVVAFITVESEARLIVDWPALGTFGARQDSQVSLTIGPYDRPAGDTLAAVFAAVTNQRARIDPSHPSAVVVTSAEGDAGRAALDAALAKRVADPKAWAALDVPLAPANLTGVPLAEALFPAASLVTDGPRPGAGLLVDWAGLKDLGLTPDYTINIGLPAHRVGHRLTAIAATVEYPLWWGGLKFDVIDGGVLVSTAAAFPAVRAAIDRLNAAGGGDELNARLLAAFVPEIENWDFRDRALGEVMAFLGEATGGAVAVDWPTLAACGLDPKTPATLISSEPIPLGKLLPLILRPPAGRPAVVWDVKDGKLTARGPAGR